MECSIRAAVIFAAHPIEYCWSVSFFSHHLGVVRRPLFRHHNVCPLSSLRCLGLHNSGKRTIEEREGYVLQWAENSFHPAMGNTHDTRVGRVSFSSRNSSGACNSLGIYYLNIRTSNASMRYETLIIRCCSGKLRKYDAAERAECSV